MLCCFGFADSSELSEMLSHAGASKQKDLRLGKNGPQYSLISRLPFRLWSATRVVYAFEVARVEERVVVDEFFS